MGGRADGGLEGERNDDRIKLNGAHMEGNCQPAFMLWLRAKKKKKKRNYSN